MSAYDDGGSAFPKAHTVADANHAHFKVGQQGMSLRDYFAAQAMNGIIAEANPSNATDWVAVESYAIADAMLSAREASK